MDMDGDAACLGALKRMLALVGWSAIETMASLSFSHPVSCAWTSNVPTTQR